VRKRLIAGMLPGLLAACAHTAPQPIDAPGAPAARPPAAPGGSGPADLARYSPYNSIQRLIASHVQYPRRAWRGGQEGTCVVRVQFARDGTIEEVRIIRSSRVIALDAECRNVLGRIARLPAIPQTIAPETNDFVLEMPIRFELQ
jgi:TonB family protein